MAHILLLYYKHIPNIQANLLFLFIYFQTISSPILSYYFIVFLQFIIYFLLFLFPTILLHINKIHQILCFPNKAILHNLFPLNILNLPNISYISPHFVLLILILPLLINVYNILAILFCFHPKIS